MLAESMSILDDVLCRLEKISLKLPKAMIESQEECKIDISSQPTISGLTAPVVAKKKDDHVSPLIVCGPSGVGKGTLLSMLREKYANKWKDSVSHTTRAPRSGEVNGKHYHFVSKEEFKKIEFVERAEYAGNYYGTSKSELKRVCRGQSDQRVPLFEVVIASAKEIVQVCMADGVRPNVLFINTSGGIDVLKERIIKRTKNSGKIVDQADLDKRLSAAKIEMSYLDNDPGFFDHILYNDKDVSETFDELVTLVERWYPQLKTVSAEDIEDTKLDE